jgi:amino acid transporter
METEKKPDYGVGLSPDPAVEGAGIVENLDGLQRRLSNRQIQWIAIGGSIGTALFVSIAWGLVEGGPGSLFIAFTVYSLMMALVNSSMAEMAVAHPVSGGFVRQASYWVDEVCICDAMGYSS